MPYQFRFTLNNKTGIDLKDLKIVGNKELVLGDLKSENTLKVAFKDYVENSNIDLICQLSDNNIDTLNLASGMTNSYGYHYNVDLRIESGHLIKDQ